MDIRDAPAWERLDKALTRIEGRRAMEQRQGQPGQLGASPGASPGSVGGLDDEWDEDEPNAEGEDEEPSEASSSSGAASAGVGAGAKGGRRALFDGLRQQAAQKLRQLANNAASHIKRTQLRLRLTFSLLEGTMAVSR